MTPRSSSATEAARQLWTRAAGDTSAPEELGAAAERMCAQLRAGLGRWIGAEGYRTLHARALVLARAAHPVLGGLSCFGGDGTATTAAVRAHSVSEVADGMVGLVTALIELLGRIIGAEMAVHLVEQVGIPSPRGVVSTIRNGGRDG